MIFIVEKMFTDHQARLEAWERARDKWKETHDYYSSSDYEDRFPRPGHALKIGLRVLLVSLAVLAAVGLTIGLAMDTKDNNHSSSKPKTSAEQKSVTFKVGDKVQVVYGDYENSVGDIVKLTDGDAIIKLSNSTWTHAMCNAASNCSSGGGKDNGELLGVASLKNLVPFKETK